LGAAFLNGRLADYQMCPEGHGDTPPQVSEEREEYDAEGTDDGVVELIVGCFCERGRHRSVAFAEELSRHKWPRDWAVEIHHRDVDEVNNGKKRDKRNKSSAHRKNQDDHGVRYSDTE
jgi:hypothetical protein